MLQVTANHVEYVVSECEAVADSSLVSYCGNEHIFAFCQSSTRHTTDVLDQRSLSVASDEHLEHGYVTVLWINILEAFLG